MSLNKALLFTCFLIGNSLLSFSQIDSSKFQRDTSIYKVDLNVKDISETDPTRKSWLRKNPVKALVAPAALIGLGAILIKNPIYDRFDFRTDLRTVFPHFKGTTIDNYLIFTPYVELVALNLVKIKCQNDFINTSLIVVKSEIVNVALTFGVKYLTNITRPNGERWSWPSGHTSEAFLAATIVNREFRYKSPWYGVAAYGVATSVGLFRMLNNKHWLSDVVAGAGFGIFSANLTYITHKWKWGRPGTCFVPFIMNGKPALAFTYKF